MEPSLRQMGDVLCHSLSDDSEVAAGHPSAGCTMLHYLSPTPAISPALLPGDV